MATCEFPTQDVIAIGDALEVFFEKHREKSVLFPDSNRSH